MGGRVHKSLMNAEVNLLFYFLSLFLTFFSRKIFLDNLGTEFIGLTGTLNNILGYLNLSELGISACIGYFLFKPLQTGNRQAITNRQSPGNTEHSLAIGLSIPLDWWYHTNRCLYRQSLLPIHLQRSEPESAHHLFCFLLFSGFLADRLLHQLSTDTTLCRSEKLSCCHLLPVCQSSQTGSTNISCLCLQKLIRVGGH